MAKSAKPVLPTKILVGPHEYTVRLDADRVEEAEATLGMTRPHLQEIALHPSQGVSRMRETLVHEVLHAVFADTGAGDWSGLPRPLLTKDGEERLVAAVAPRLLELLRRNPRLLEYLVG